MPFALFVWTADTEVQRLGQHQVESTVSNRMAWFQVRNVRSARGNAWQCMATWINLGPSKSFVEIIHVNLLRAVRQTLTRNKNCSISLCGANVMAKPLGQTKWSIHLETLKHEGFGWVRLGERYCNATWTQTCFDGFCPAVSVQAPLLPRDFGYFWSF